MSEPAPLGLLLEGPAAEAEAWLAAWGFEAPGPARRALQALFRAVRDPALALRFLDALLARLRACPDPDRALNHLERWVAQIASVRDALATLTDDVRLFDDLLLLFGTSDYLADILVREPTAYTLLLGNEARPPDLPMLRARLDAAVDLFPRASSRLDALRRFKRRELLRIAWRDLTARDDFNTVVQAISDLTEALIGKALAVCQAELAAKGSPSPAPPAFAVVAMGKLGGRELNYSSDVDLLFLCDVDADDDRGLRQATRLAEELVAALSRPTAEGHLFRVDMRLRPEGRYGALVRSLASYRDYYDHWVETWERQALLKARFIAGDADLGERFERMVEPHVYRRILSNAIFEDVRDVKLAIERRVGDAGQAHTNVKEGRGTIRDIEFAVQLLQLLFGAERPDLRARATLPAIERLAAAELLTPEEAGCLSDHYRFFRTVEHRLQLMSDLPVRLLPEAPSEQRKLARRMGYPPEAADRFMADYAARAAAVRRITGEIVDRLAGGPARVGSTPGAPLLRALVLELTDGSAGREEDESGLTRELERLGFLEPAAAAAIVARLARGGPHGSLPMATRRVFAELAETLLPRAGASPDPEGALRALEGLARRMGTYQTFYRTLLDQPDMVEALCVVAGASPWVAEEITRRPELMDAFTDPEFVRQPRSVEALLDEARRRRDAARGGNARRNALRRFKKRELLRIAARDLFLQTAPREITEELAHLADVCLCVGLEIAQETLFPERAAPLGSFAVIGLGRLGGEELHYSSDLDLLYLYDPLRETGYRRQRRGRRQGSRVPAARRTNVGQPEGAVPSLQHSHYEALATELSSVMQEVMEEGRLYEIDLRLRPEGKSGLMLVHLDGARQYYGPGGRSQTWEKQSLIKARFVAGDAGLAEEFLALVQPEVYPADPPPERDAEVRAMKRRIETERLGTTEAGARAERGRRHVKLGPGGLSDVEFLVQYLQLRHGGRHPELRVRNTGAALAALAAEAILPAADANTLADHYAFLTRLRQRLYLRSAGVATDVLPTDPLEQRRLARTMDLPDGDALQAEYGRRAAEVRALFTQYLRE